MEVSWFEIKERNVIRLKQETKRYMNLTRCPSNFNCVLNRKVFTDDIEKIRWKNYPKTLIGHRRVSFDNQSAAIHNIKVDSVKG